MCLIEYVAYTMYCGLYDVFLNIGIWVIPGKEVMRNGNVYSCQHRMLRTYCLALSRVLYKPFAHRLKCPFSSCPALSYKKNKHHFSCLPHPLAYMHHLILIILSAILCMPSFASSTLCFDHDNPLNPWQRTLVECSGTANSRPLRKRRGDQSAFKIDFTCYAQDHVCQRARRAFDHAGVLISQAIAFKTPVTVNATFIPFCQGLGECSKGHLVTLGGSYPARTVALTQSDGVVRLYPQALVKQMDIQSHPSYGPYDIVSLFNAEAPFWFEVWRSVMREVWSLACTQYNLSIHNA